MKKSLSAGGVVINQKGKILVVSQHGNSWSLPKGHLNIGEDEITAAKREIYEESGVEIDKLEVIKDLGSYERFRIYKNPHDKFDDKSELKTIHLFLFKTKEVKLAPLDPDNPEARWINKNKVADLLTHPKDKEFFQSIMDKI
jgi:ADP-ribose pyrophosphatase YjhB (NUDIX family)